MLGLSRAASLSRHPDAPTSRMGTYADQLARARALLHARIPPDLATWILAQLDDQVRADYLRKRRDEYLRQAGELIGGTVNGRASQILRHAAPLERCWPVYRERDPEPGTALGAVHSAMRIMPIPKRRQLLKVLQRGVHSSPL